MLNREQYEKLCSLCDKVLSEKSTKSTIAISWLHINRWHPVLLKEHKYFFDKTYKFNFHIVNGYLFTTFVVKSIYRLIKSLTIYKIPKILNITKKEIDILFISHLINKSEIGKSNDSYYGELPETLRENGITSAIAKVNHTKLNFDVNEKNWGSGADIPRFILPGLLNFKYEFRIFIDQIKEFKRLIINSFKASGAAKDILICSSVFAMSPSTADNMRYAFQMRLLQEKIRPKCVIVTYEGFAWERLTFAVSRKINTHVKCIGYQNTAIFESQHSSFRDLSHQYNADFVFTTGEITKKQIESLVSPKKNFDIKTLGSRQAKVSEKNQIIKEFKEACIVAPESFTSETRLLFDFSILCAIKNPNIKFIWRLHPKSNRDNLMRENPDYSKLPINILLSEEPLENDILNSSFILYRGSTTVLPAISSGLIPIYFKRKNEMSIDPIYDLKKGKITVLKEPNFELIRKEFHNLKTILSLQNYGAKYYTPFNVECIKEILVN